MATQDIDFAKSRYSTAYAKSLAQKYKNFDLPSPRYYNGVFGFKFLQMLNKPFNKWQAFKKGLIDEDGYEIKKPSNRDELSSYNYFVKLVARLKQLMDKQLPDVRRQLIFDRLFLVRESNNDTEKYWVEVAQRLSNVLKYIDYINNKEMNELIEASFSGDMATSGAGFANRTGGNKNQIPTNSGIHKGMEKLGTMPKTKKRKKPKLINFKDYVLKDIKNKKKD